MSLDQRYFDYLQHFGSTVSLAEANAHAEARDQIALRHDVDHDLDFALEMSYWECERGIRASYYLLHTAKYWTDSQLLDKALQIQDFGHEIGLHVNALSLWYQNEIDDVAGHLLDTLDALREAGLRIVGVSAHGDRCCYRQQFINYWLFRELRPADPASDEAGKSPEGIRVETLAEQIQYPGSHQLLRDDGKTFDLWSISLGDLSLAYDAVHVPHDRYFTDTGGEWTRSPDPLGVPLDRGRVQVLMHPIYYRGPQQIYYFLSTARSGSKWLANLLDKATPLTAKHEFTLNHRLDDQHLVADHRTGSGYVDLQRRPDEARKLMIDLRLWLEDLPGDYAEANVYLEPFRSAFEEVFPDAVTVHVVRHPQDVVRSLLNRDWYDTPEDNRHPELSVDDWPQLSQFEKCCWYVQKTNETLSDWCRFRLPLESMTADVDWLTAWLRRLKLPFYPRLAAAAHREVINANKRQEFPSYGAWTEDMKQTFGQICGPGLSELGYDAGNFDTNRTTKVQDDTYDAQQLALAVARPDDRHIIQPEVLYETRFRQRFGPWYRHDGCRCVRRHAALELRPNGDRHAYLLFAGNGWSKQSRWGRRAWHARPATYYRVSIEGQTAPQGRATLYCLMYDRQGNLLTQRALGSLDARPVERSFAFRIRCDAPQFSVALFVSKHKPTDWVCLNWFRIEGLPMVPAV